MCDESNISPIPLTVWTWKITSLLKCSPCIIRFTYNSVGCSVFRVVQPSLLLNSRTFHQIVIANIESVQFSCSLVSWLFATQWTAAHQTSLSITNSWSLLKFMPSKHLILCHPIPLPSGFPSIRVFSNESVLYIRWPKYWSFSFSISPSNEYSGLISFRIDWFDLLAVQGTQESSPTPQLKSISSSALSVRYGPALTSVHDYW